MARRRDREGGTHEELLGTDWSRVTGSREVDLVLTSAEVVELLEKRGLDFLSLPPSGLPALLC
eukprot:1691759-Rhodomonas_salina.1